MNLKYEEKLRIFHSLSDIIGMMQISRWETK